jgi:hypothetical protein
VGGGSLVGLLLFDFWIVDASITHRAVLGRLLVGSGIEVVCVFVVLYIVLCLDHFVSTSCLARTCLLCVLVVCVASW